MLKIRYKKFWLDVGWFEGEPISLLHLTVIDYFMDFLTIFHVKVYRFLFAVGFYL